MSTIAAVLQQVADAAAATGAQVALDPGQVGGMLSRSGPVLLVGAPDLTTVGLTGRVSLSIPLLLFVQPPANWSNVSRAYDVLELLLPVFPGEWSPSVADIGDLSLPAFTTTIGRKTP